MSREYQLLRSTAKPGHPFTQFGTGNFTTLHDMPNAEHINVRATVPTILWHSKHVWPCDWTLSAYVELSATADESAACADDANLLRATGSAGRDCASIASLVPSGTVRLRLQVRDKLLEFHRRYYSANTMKLTERALVCSLCCGRALRSFP